MNITIPNRDFPKVTFRKKTGILDSYIMLALNMILVQCNYYRRTHLTFVVFAKLVWSLIVPAWPLVVLVVLVYSLVVLVFPLVILDCTLQSIYIITKFNQSIRRRTRDRKITAILKVANNISTSWCLFKVGLSPSKKFFLICFNYSPSPMMKNDFYFMLKALFVLKIFKFLSWLIGHVEKTAWLER